MRLTLIFSILFLMACSHHPIPIQYGKDQCDYCKMGISDTRFGAELISKKGKVMRFDSDECLLHFLMENKEPTSFEQILVTDYAHPGTLIDAHTAIHARSNQITSPMGENVASFSKKEEALNLLPEKELLDWNEFQNILK